MTTRTGSAGKRGRPQLVTRERIADAGIELTIPEITLAALAEKMGVSVRSLYKHTSGIDEIQQIVAEEIFARWQMPPFDDDTFDDYVLTFSRSLRLLALGNPGISEFLTQFRLHHSTFGLQLLREHHEAVSQRYGLDLARTSYVLAVTAEHALAVVELIHRPRSTTRRRGAHPENPVRDGDAVAVRNDELRFDWSMRALIRGLQETFDDLPAELRADQGKKDA